MAGLIATNKGCADKTLRYIFQDKDQNITFMSLNAMMKVVEAFQSRDAKKLA